MKKSRDLTLTRSEATRIISENASCIGGISGIILALKTIKEVDKNKLITQLEEIHQKLDKNNKKLLKELPQ